jgi:predicted aminopeptidase
MIKKVFLLFFTFFLVSVFSNFSSIIYGVLQLQGQLRIISGSVEIDELLEKNDLPDSLKSKFALVAEIRKFSVRELGLKRSENYTSYFDQEGEPVLWVLSACPEFSLEPHVWKFPVAGEFPYKGFFDLERGKQEELALNKRHFDTDLSLVEGWSTLGFFKDPVLSNMLIRDEGWLANLIIHELSHGTIFFKDSVEFNENLANFIGIKGSILFLELKYGPGHERVNHYLLGLKRRKLFSDFMIKMASKLDSTYKSFEPNRSILEKRELKKSKLESIKLQWDQTKMIDFFDSIPDTLWVLDNTVFAGFLRYNSQYEFFEREMEEKYEGSIRKMIQGFKD